MKNPQEEMIDVTTLETAQEMFSYAVKKTIFQGKKSRNTEGLCLYRGPDDLKCSVGHLLTDEEADKIGNISALDLKVMVNESLEKSEVMPMRLHPHLDLLIELQKAHDRAEDDDFVTDFLTRAAEVARKYNLEMP